MSMTRKDFEAIAATIRDLEVGSADDSKTIKQRNRTQVALAMADTLVSQSDTFQVVKFLKACGVTGTVDSIARMAMRHSDRLRIRLENTRTLRGVSVTYV